MGNIISGTSLSRLITKCSEFFEEESILQLNMRLIDNKNINNNMLIYYLKYGACFFC